ncbi:MAG: hypothetical protein E6I80_09155 [Chloroflexi bacterium]|nr:MAG: hypothetical protein E6I80_09155 [Chloroflexota bacterium]
MMNTYGSTSTGIVQCITLTCSCQKPLRFSPLMHLVDHSRQRPMVLDEMGGKKGMAVTCRASSARLQ